jgi:PTS system nitrogen regulatory IIA component
VNIEDILTPNRTFCKLEASSRKRALEEVAIRLAETIEDVSAEELFTRLIAREKMGSTALGHGIAIPHCRIPGCSNIMGGLVSLSSPVDFDAFDHVNVEIMFVLIVPEEEVDDHLTALAMLAKRFESESYREALFAAGNEQALYASAIAGIEPDAKQALS